MKRIRILIADDHALLRRGLTTLLKCQKDFSIVGEACDGKDAVDTTIELKPDVIVMDLSMPVMDGVEASRQIHKLQPESRILILTTFGTSIDVTHAVQAGATGALVKDSDDDDLISAIRAVADGRSVFSPEIQAMLEKPLPPRLTDRQREILTSLAQGLSSEDISKKLGISADTVNQHINTIRAKLGAVNRTEAVTIAIRKQLLKI